MIHFHNCEQLSDEWFALRCGSLGSSSVKNAIAGGQGKSRKTLAYNLIAESITGEKTAFKTTAAMEEGTRREAESRAYYELDSGIQFEEVGLITNDNFPGQHTSPDGVNRELQVGLELKNPQANTMVKYLESGRLPPEYKAQCQHAMMITGWEEWHFMAYHPAFKRQLVVVVKRDEAYIREMSEKLGAFFVEMQKIRDKIT